MTKLRISSDLALPLDAVTQTFVVLGKRGVGKTSFGVVLAEELLQAKQQVVWCDPIGVAWGLRAAADGRAAGVPIVILGGDHGDLPLEVGAGELVADLIVDEHVSVLLDLSRFRKGEQTQFMTAFAERLYHRNREALHLILDEADAFAPQKPMRGQERMLGAVEDLVRRGRARGLGVTLITQRSAVLNKDVTTQAETLVAFRTIAPQDRAAVEAWVEVHGDRERREQVLSTLHTLPVGTAWVWSPAWLEKLERVMVRARRTFDSSATPKAGEHRRGPKTLAEVDLDAFRSKMAATIERAKTTDPRELQKRIRDLEGKLKDAERATAHAFETTQYVEKRVEVPILKNGQLARAERLIAKAASLADHLDSIGVDLSNVSLEISSALSAASSPVHQTEPGLAMSRSPGALSLPGSKDGAAVRAAPRSTGRGSAVAPKTRPTSGADRGPVRTIEGLSPTQQRILDRAALMERLGVAPGLMPLAAWVDVHPNGGRFRADIRALRQRGLLGDSCQLSDSGRAAAVEEDASLSATHLETLGIVRALTRLGVSPSSTTIAAWRDVHPNGGRFRADLRDLQERGLLDRGLGLSSAGDLLAPESTRGPMERLDPTQRRILEEITASGAALTVGKLAERLAVHPNGGRFRSNIARLADMGLIRSRNDLAATQAVAV